MPAKPAAPGRKNYVLDTNVLLHDPMAIFRFAEHNIHLPITVIEEIDNFKKNMDSKGRAARQTSRFLDELRLKGSFQHGISLGEGMGLLFVELESRVELASLPRELKTDKADNMILALALAVHERTKASGATTIVVTKDTNLRIKADVLGLPAEDYEHGKVEFDELYTGTRELDNLTEELVDRFHRERGLDLGLLEPGDDTLLANQFITGHVAGNPKGSLIGRVDIMAGRLVPILNFEKQNLWGLKPRNREQKFALDALLNPDIKVVTLVGKAGTGKTLMAIAAGLVTTGDEQLYNRTLISRPVFPMGKDLGFLPGDIEEKLAPWMQPIFDNVDYLLAPAEDHKGMKQRSYKELEAQGILQIEPLTYIRGRSIPKQYMIVDEAQNLTPHEVKTILTRAGEGTKIVLTGDPYQIDNPYIDANSNGLTYVVDRFRAERLAAHITLTKGERSELAELSANLL